LAERAHSHHQRRTCGWSAVGRGRTRSDPGAGDGLDRADRNRLLPRGSGHLGQRLPGLASRQRGAGRGESVMTASDLVPDVMRAAVLFGPNDLRVVEKAVPSPARDEVLVRVAMCGACGTDLAIQAEPFPGQPAFGSFTPGHEWTGTVVSRGAGVDEVDVGQRVAIHVHHGCGRCRNCLTGSYTACENYGDREKGHRATGFTTDGGLAEYVVHNVSCVYPLPDNLSWEESVLVSTAGTSVHGLDRAGGLVAGDTVVVIGPGPVGIM